MGKASQRYLSNPYKYMVLYLNPNDKITGFNSGILLRHESFPIEQGRIGDDT